jgi:lipopolysaccharide transport system ATP-binding protein
MRGMEIGSAAAVEVENVSKYYPLSGSRLGRLRHLLGSGKPQFPDKADAGLWALRDVSFSVARGEAFGIIGSNGSGKSTLLQIVAGILRPASGSVRVSGRLSALLELGSGFSPEFTGRDNVYLNGSLLGLSREEIHARFADIERFAGIGDFIEQPIRTYSTGMVLRLAFAVAAHVDPEILIVDEALAVGDISFRQRCMRKIHELRGQGVTILFVSHETGDVKALCERCLWLQNGVVQALGEADGVVAKYLSATLQREISHAPGVSASPPAARSGASPDLLEKSPEIVEEAFATAFQGHRYGDGRATILSGALLTSSGRSIRTLASLDRAVLRVTFRVDGPIHSAIAGFLLRNHKGENIFGSNSARENYPIPFLSTGETHTVDFHWTAPELVPGSYRISIAIADGNVDQCQMCDYVEDAVEVGAAGVRSRGYIQLHCAAVEIHR